MAAPGATPSASDVEEPKTPLWLTFLGGALFLLAGVYVLLSRDPEPLDAGEPAAAPAEAAAPAAPSEAPAGH